jgi:hypothetical protein
MPKRATSIEDRVVADTCGIAGVATVEPPLHSFTLIAFGTPVL